MTRTSKNSFNNNNKCDSLPHQTFYSEIYIISSGNSKKNTIKCDAGLELMLLNRETDIYEHGRMFTPNIKDNDRIYSFLSAHLSGKDKALEYSRSDIDRILGISANVVTCVENASNAIVGITISYPSELVSRVAKKEGWHHAGGFNSKYFNKFTIYNELRAVDPKYRGGLGKLLLNKLVCDSTDNGFSEVVLFSIDSAYQNHINFGFESIQRTKLCFPQKTIQYTYLMNLIISDNLISESIKALNYHILK